MIHSPAYCGSIYIGNDDIINEFVKTTIEFMLPVYVNLFNKVLCSGVLPKSWLEGVIIPIYKKSGNPADPGNYRGITKLVFVKVTVQMIMCF